MFDFGEAFKIMKEGFLVRRKAWSEGVAIGINTEGSQYIFLERRVEVQQDGETRVQREYWGSSQADILKSDWETF